MAHTGGKISYHNIPWEILNSHRGVAEDSGLSGCQVVSTGKHFPTFRRVVVPSSSGKNKIRRVFILASKNVGNKIVRNVGN